ncbi:SDR family NAD(P)-dependent oxidoreductase [Thermococcus camini]|uniref:Cyclopentanol dehydrogenase n=1 Tax=Thermococcus camini TaxID=2016373 RepID=A0A7G2D9Y8_9EURY|nr:SDR family oxidoreductase [Thermococcus camini]CAD5245301.1 Cyclopentanol dehydrogenase [Thermococcus camini]
MGRVEGKVAIVTGATSGIGRAIAKLLAREGAKVAVTGRNEERGRKVVEEIISEGGTAKFWKLDVSNEAEVERVFREVVEEFGKLDILVNNAGISGPDKPTHELTEGEWDQVMDVNVKGVFFCTKHAVPYMIKNGGGSIVNVSSIYGIVGSPGIPPYHASKGAVRLMTKTDALLYAKYGIRVNSVHPGSIWTPMLMKACKKMGVDDEEQCRGVFAKMNPVGFVGEPMDVAYAVLYLASDESRFVTGAELVVDGGYTAM